MGQVLHDSATTGYIGASHNQESLIALAERYMINPKTVAK
jgi:hypothetical protein